jgi:hypothetical protein
MDVVETMLNMDTNLEDVDPGPSETDILDDYVYLSTGERVRKNKENMINYTDIDYEKDILINNDKKQDAFRSENCIKGELTNKDVSVKYEMTEHVFPEIKFRRGACNPCLKTCEFSIVESKINTEEKLRPKET